MEEECSYNVVQELHGRIGELVEEYKAFCISAGIKGSVQNSPCTNSGWLSSVLRV